MSAMKHHDARRLSTSALLALVLLAACRSDGTPGHELTGEPSVPQPTRLEEDVAWLADDARDGRRAGTAGEHAAADWIAARMDALGLEPAGEDGWFQEFTVPIPARDAGGSAITAADGDRYADPRLLVPLFCSSGEEASGPVVFAGYGISDAELDRDDYEGLDVEGAVVVLVRGTPPVALLPESTDAAEVENPHGGPAPGSGPSWGNAGSLFHKVMEAKRRGAIAVLVALHPDRLEEGLLPFDSGRTALANVPALMIQLPVAEALVPGYSDHVASLDAGERIGAVATGGEASVRPDVVRATGTARNVLGVLYGSGGGPTLVLGAHYDHLGRGGPGSLAREGQGMVHNGADDNASGTAVVLEMARCLSTGEPLAGDLVFALWSGEELGLLGSEHWAQNPTVPLEDVALNLNFDMVGRAGSGALQVMGAGTSPAFAGWLEEAGPRASLDLTVSLSGQGVGGSDHQTFIKRSIPALHFFSGIHSDYHRPSDDTERFEADGSARVAFLAMDLVRRADAAVDLPWVEPEAPAAGARTAGGFRTRFGSIPEYSYDGKGLMLAGTSEGGPAERAGLLKDDLITRIDDVTIEGIGDFMYVLNAHKPGDVLRVYFQRGGNEEMTRVTLESADVE
jgi:hypothetical protein